MRSFLSIRIKCALRFVECDVPKVDLYSLIFNLTRRIINETMEILLLYFITVITVMICVRVCVCVFNRTI